MEDYVGEVGVKVKDYFLLLACKGAHSQVGWIPTPHPSSRGGEEKRLAFLTINQITSLHALPLWDHVGEGIFRS